MAGLMETAHAPSRSSRITECSPREKLSPTSQDFRQAEVDPEQVQAAHGGGQ